jgi:hypothetical protein
MNYELRAPACCAKFESVRNIHDWCPDFLSAEDDEGMHAEAAEALVTLRVFALRFLCD